MSAVAGDSLDYEISPEALESLGWELVRDTAGFRAVNREMCIMTEQCDTRDIAEKLACQIQKAVREGRVARAEGADPDEELREVSASELGEVATAVEKWIYTRTAGGKSVIVEVLVGPLNENGFDKFVKPSMNPGSLLKMGTFESFKRTLPTHTHLKLLRVRGEKTWQYDTTGTMQFCRPINATARRV